MMLSRAIIYKQNIDGRGLGKSTFFFLNKEEIEAVLIAELVLKLSTKLKKYRMNERVFERYT